MLLSTSAQALTKSLMPWHYGQPNALVPVLAGLFWKPFFLMTLLRLS
jgi:hypothetical protein